MSKSPLENVPQERAVLGALIGNSQSFWIYKERVKADLFTLHSHIRIVQIMHTLVEANREITLPAIVTRMPEGDQDWSPAGYIATLVADEADPEHITENLADLEDMWARREMMKLGAELMRQAVEDNGMDSVGRIEAAKEKMEAMHDPLASTVKHVFDVATGLLERTQAAMISEKVVGIDVGLKGLQDLTGPFMPGRFILLPGSSGSGKSALAQQVATFAAEKNNVLFFQLEMEADEMVERDLAGRAGVAADKIERAALNDADMDNLWDKADELQGLKFHIDASTNLTVAQMRARAMRMKRLKGLDMVLVDHARLIQAGDKRSGEFEAYDKNLAALKRMAKDLNISVVLLAQLKSSYGDGAWNTIRPPNINDIYGGSANENHPDVIAFVYREEYLLRRKEPAETDKTRADYMARLDAVEGKAQIILAKRRGGKGAGTRTIFFEGDRVRFADQPPRGKVVKQAAFELDPEKTF